MNTTRQDYSQKFTKRCAALYCKITGVAAAITFIAWVNNIFIALQWNPDNGHGYAYVGIHKWVDMLAVDFSTISTAIPFIGLLLASIGFHRISKANKGTTPSEFFPFFKTYVSITVALGLIGTVWGLIMIGYYPPETVQMAELMLCLRTALYSTLVALIWVFLIVIPTRFLMQRMFRRATGYVDVGSGDFIGVLKDMSSAAVNVKNSLVGSIQKITDFNAGLEKAKNLLNGIVEKMDTFVKGTQTIMINTHNILTKIQGTLDKIDRVNDAKERAIRSLTDQLARAEKRNAEANTRIQGLIAENSRLSQKISGASKQLD